MAEKKTKSQRAEAEEKLESEKELNEVEETIESTEDLLKTLEKTKEENEKYYEHLQRTTAEFDNYKKRVQKEKEAIYSLAIGDVVAKYIPILDNLEKAINTETEDKGIKEGIIMIHKQMLDVMSSLNVEVIPTVNEIFDPEMHDAVMHIESEDYGEKVVVEELRKGYKIGNRVLRHSMVKVAN